MRDTTNILKDIGYTLHSDLAYKAFPEENPWYLAYYGGQFLSVHGGAPTVNDFVNNRKG